MNYEVPNLNDDDDDSVEESILTYCCQSVIMKNDSIGNEKEYSKLYLHNEGMNFDKVLSLFSQDSSITFHNLTCFIFEDNLYSYTKENTVSDKGFEFIEGYRVFVWNENIGELRKFLKENYIRVSKFFFTVDIGIHCYNNQNRFKYLEIDLEIPYQSKEAFLTTVSLVDNCLGEILKEVEKFPNCFLSFINDELVVIFPNVYNNLNSEFILPEKYAEAISLGFIESLLKYPFEW